MPRYASRSTLAKRYAAYQIYTMKRYPKNIYTSNTRRRAFRKGFDRTGGSYGRYNRGIAGVSRPEQKSHESTIGVTVATTAVIPITSLNLLAEGTARNQRIGRRVTIRSINVHWQVTLPNFEAQVDPPVGDAVRIMLCIDKQCNGAVTPPENIILPHTSYLAFRNLAETHRIKVLWDKTININYQSTAQFLVNNFAGGGQIKTGAIFKKVNITIMYDDTGADLATISSNNIIILVVGRQGVAGFSTRNRIRYTDD